MAGADGKTWGEWVRAADDVRCTRKLTWPDSMGMAPARCDLVDGHDGLCQYMGHGAVVSFGDNGKLRTLKVESIDG